MSKIGFFTDALVTMVETSVLKEGSFMRQIRGEYGNINTTGQPDSPGLLLNSSEKGFLEEIEDGIRPVIEACLAVGLDTYSSCEGHNYGSERIPDARFADVLIENEHVQAWKSYIGRLNHENDLNIVPILIEDKIDVMQSIGTRPYNSPVRFKIIIPEPVEKSTEVLARSIRNGEFPKL